VYKPSRLPPSPFARSSQPLQPQRRTWSLQRCKLEQAGSVASTHSHALHARPAAQMNPAKDPLSATAAAGGAGAGSAAAPPSFRLPLACPEPDVLRDPSCTCRLRAAFASLRALAASFSAWIAASRATSLAASAAAAVSFRAACSGADACASVCSRAAAGSATAVWSAAVPALAAALSAQGGTVWAQPAHLSPGDLPLRTVWHCCVCCACPACGPVRLRRLPAHCGALCCLQRGDLAHQRVDAADLAAWP